MHRCLGSPASGLKYNAAGMFGSPTIEVNDTLGAAGGGDGWRTAALERIGRQYSEYCPRVTITFTAVEGDDLFRRYLQAVQGGRGPDLLLISSEYTTRLASAKLVTWIYLCP